MNLNDINHEGFKRAIFHQGDIVVSVIGSGAVGLQELELNMRNRGLVEKYRRKAQKSIVFGVLCNGRVNTFDSIIYLDFLWSSDPKMQKYIEMEPITIPPVIPGRNKSCFCGSGKKYKKCCRDKVEQAQRLN